MLQKIINGIAIASGVVSITVVGAVGIVYFNKDAIIENVKSKVMESVLPGGMSGILGEGAGTGALEGLSGAGLGLPAPSNPIASPDDTAEPTLPLGF